MFKRLYFGLIFLNNLAKGEDEAPNTAIDLTGPRFEPLTSRSGDKAFTLDQLQCNEIFNKFLS